MSVERGPIATSPFKPRDPRPFLLAGFIEAFVVWLILVYMMDPTVEADLAPAANLVAYAVGFFFSAYVGMHIYFFTTSQSQDRQFRQEYTTTHVEVIYAPLYDEVAKTVRELEDYGSPWLIVWPEKKGTHYASFVDDALRRQMDALESFLSVDIRGAQSRGYDAGGASIVDVLRSTYGSRIPESQYETIRGHIAPDSKFLCDPSTTRPREMVRSQIRSLLGNVDGTLVTDEDLDRVFSKMKQSLNALPEVARFRDARKMALEIAVPLREALKERVLRPYELR